MDWNTRFEVTPIGAYVNRLHTIDRRLDALEHPGIYHEDPRVQRLARAALSAVDTLRGTVRDELDRFGALPLGPDPEEHWCDGCQTLSADLVAYPEADLDLCPVCRGERPPKGATEEEWEHLRSIMAMTPEEVQASYVACFGND